MSISLVPHLTWAPPSTVHHYVCFNCINSTKFLMILRFIPESPHQGKVYFSTAVLARWWPAYAILLYKKKKKKKVPFLEMCVLFWPRMHGCAVRCYVAHLPTQSLGGAVKKRALLVLLRTLPISRIPV